MCNFTCFFTFFIQTLGEEKKLHYLCATFDYANSLESLLSWRVEAVWRLRIGTLTVSDQISLFTWVI